MGYFITHNPLVLLIGVCEVGFWVLVIGGLVARYLLRAPRLSTVLLIGVPVADVVLVVASLADLAGGSPPGLAHGLAAVYLGFTVAFGHSLIRWADVRFAHRYAGGPPPPKPPRYGTAKVVHEWREWGKLALAWGITVGVLFAMAAVAGTGVPAPLEWGADPMWSWAARLVPVVVIWFVGWPLSTTLLPPSEPEVADVRH
ncbi:MAG: hypothetical protein ACRDRH_01585 [Pseudonocardia sp.]